MAVVAGAQGETEVKRPGDVGKDFDEYATAWRADAYAMEVGAEGPTLLTDESKRDEVQRAGDEWGAQEGLRALYEPLFARLLGPGRAPASINVVEIGAGGGRSTAAMLDVFGDALGDYHVVDVSEAFTRVLAERIQRPINIHVVDDVDLSALPTDHFHLCLAQSSWSHVSLYDQYRYLRELRRVMRHGAPVVVSGVFLLGAGDDWTWNRFRRRVHQIDEGISGVYHEVNSMDAVAEMLTRLEYEIEVVASHGFVARARQRNPKANVAELGGKRLSYPQARDLAQWVASAPVAADEPTGKRRR